MRVCVDVVLGEGKVEEDGNAATIKYLPTSGDRPDAASDHRCQKHTG